jgi:hypothetical protein
MMRTARLAILVGFAVLIAAVPARALPILPGTGLTDFVFDFSGPGGDVTFGGDSALTIALAVDSTFRFHVEDCCVAGDEFALYVDGLLTPWSILEQFGGDGSPNGAAVMGPGAVYFEALATLILPAGVHTLDLEQTSGIPGGTYLQVSPAEAVVPEPTTLLLLGGGIAALGRRLHRRREV